MQIKSFKTYLENTGSFNKIPPNKWITLTADDKLNFGKKLIELVTTAYFNTPLGSFVKNQNDVNASEWTVFNNGTDICSAIFYRVDRPNEHWKEYKIQGIGHDNTQENKKRIVFHLKDLLDQHGWWIECNGPVAKSLYKVGAPFVTDENIARAIFPDTNLRMIDDKGRYNRNITSTISKDEVIFGNPVVKTKSNIQEYINKTKTDCHDIACLFEDKNILNDPLIINNENYGNLRNVIPGARVSISNHAMQRTGERSIDVNWIIDTLRQSYKDHKDEIDSIPDGGEFVIFDRKADIAVAKMSGYSPQTYEVRTVHKTIRMYARQNTIRMSSATNKKAGTNADPTISITIDNVSYSIHYKDLVYIANKLRLVKIYAKKLKEQAKQAFDHESRTYSLPDYDKANSNDIVYVIADNNKQFHLAAGEYTVLKKLGYNYIKDTFNSNDSEKQVNAKVIPVNLLKDYNMSLPLSSKRHVPENTFKQYLDQFADKLSQPKMIVENPKTMIPIQTKLSLEERIQRFKYVELDEISLHDIPNILRENLHRDIPIVEDYYEFELDSEEWYREALINENHLFENDEEYIRMRDFLLSIKSDSAIPGHEYVYALFEMTPIISYKFLAVKYTSKPQKLSKIVDGIYYFENAGKYKPLTSRESLKENFFKTVCLLKNPNDLDHLMTELKLKFDHIWKIKEVEIDFNRVLQESTSLILTIGDIAEKHKCSLMMVELALKQGIQQELKSSNDLKHAKRQALRKITHDIDYYKKARK